MLYTITAEKDGYTSTVTGINPDETWYRTNPNTPTYTVTITLQTTDDPSPNASAGPNITGYTGDIITFDGSASTDNEGIVSYIWDFDLSDGLQSDDAGAIVQHTYNTTGIYTVTLTVTDTNGNIDSNTTLVTVYPQIPTMIIFNVNATSITSTSTVLEWDTDKLSDSHTKYGTVSGVYTSKVYDETDTISHTLDLTGLDPVTTYYYVVNSTDPDGNSIESIEYSFTTETSTNDTPVLTQMNISLVSTPIIIDGNLDEWTGIQSVSFKDDSGRGDADNLAIVRAMWDDNNLYFAFDVTDTDLHAVKTLRDGAIWRDDSIELFIDMDHDQGTQMQTGDYHFIINLNNAIWDGQGGQDANWNSILVSAVTTDGTMGDDSDSDTGFVIEFGIPWSDIGGTPVSGSKIGLNFCVNDLDNAVYNDQYFDWCNLTSWANPDGWGNATFIGSTDHAPVLDLIGDKSINEDSLLEFTVSASDPDGNNLIYSASGLPGGASFDPDTGIFSWTPLDGQEGIYIVHFDVTDGSLIDSEDVMITVIDNPQGASQPSVINPASTQFVIPIDTDGDLQWGETSQLTVNVTSDSGIASVTIDLSPIGGLSTHPMENIGGNTWSVTTNASAGTPPQVYSLQVNATDIHGHSNTSVKISLKVMRNGDTSGDNTVNIADAMLLTNHVSYPDQYTISSEFIADVTGDGIINIADAMLLANSVSYPGYILH